MGSNYSRMTLSVLEHEKKVIIFILSNLNVKLRKSLVWFFHISKDTDRSVVQPKKNCCRICLCKRQVVKDRPRQGPPQPN